MANISPFLDTRKDKPYCHVFVISRGICNIIVDLVLYLIEWRLEQVINTWMILKYIVRCKYRIRYISHVSNVFLCTWNFVAYYICNLSSSEIVLKKLLCNHDLFIILLRYSIISAGVSFAQWSFCLIGTCLLKISNIASLKLLTLKWSKAKLLTSSWNLALSSFL